MDEPPKVGGYGWCGWLGTDVGRSGGTGKDAGGGEVGGGGGTRSSPSSAKMDLKRSIGGRSKSLDDSAFSTVRSSSAYSSSSVLCLRACTEEEEEEDDDEEDDDDDEVPGAANIESGLVFAFKRSSSRRCNTTESCGIGTLKRLHSRLAGAHNSSLCSGGWSTLGCCSSSGVCWPGSVLASCVDGAVARGAGPPCDMPGLREAALIGETYLAVVKRAASTEGSVFCIAAALANSSCSARHCAALTSGGCVRSPRR
mmetsp:Transcript_4160/g.12657  ORF Transcript_4160/g.12657 Transcript_4160/m.12657 type:complete len:255 (+) Transcript_4160:882-1646(+)